MDLCPTPLAGPLLGGEWGEPLLMDEDAQLFLPEALQCSPGAAASADGSLLTDGLSAAGMDSEDWGSSSCSSTSEGCLLDGGDPLGLLWEGNCGSVLSRGSSSAGGGYAAAPTVLGSRVIGRLLPAPQPASAAVGAAAASLARLGTLPASPRAALPAPLQAAGLLQAPSLPLGGLDLDALLDLSSLPNLLLGLLSTQGLGQERPASAQAMADGGDDSPGPARQPGGLASPGPADQPPLGAAVERSPPIAEAAAAPTAADAAPTSPSPPACAPQPEQPQQAAAATPAGTSGRQGRRARRRAPRGGAKLTAAAGPAPGAGAGEQAGASAVGERCS